jgi:hypothetical protein
MKDKEMEEYLENMKKTQEIQKIQLDILDEVYVAGNPTQTHLLVAEKINLLLNLADPNLN